MFRYKRPVLPRPACLVIATGLMMIAGCVDLDQVAQLSSISQEARDALPRVSNDFYGSCQRRTALLQRIPGEELPPNLKDITPNCAPFKDLATHLAADQAVLTDYLDALANVAANQPLNYGRTIDTDIATISGFSASASVNADLAANTKKASLAALTLTQKLANIATRHYREKKVRELILESNQAVQDLTAALAQVGGTDYGIMLDSEKGFLDAYYQGPLAAQKNERLALILVQRQYDLDVQQFQSHRESSAAYAQVMQKIGSFHNKLADAAREPSSFKDKIKHLTPDIIDLRDAVTTLRAEVK